MTDINVVIVVGRLTRDPEMKHLGSGTAVMNCSIASNRSVKRGDKWEDEVSFFDVVVWGRQAESLSKYLFKGKQIAVRGELQQQRWEHEGQKRSKVVIKADSVQMLGGKADTPQETTQDPAVQRAKEIFEDAIPF